MASRVVRIRLPLGYFAVIGLVATGFATLGTGKDLDPNSNTDWLGVIAGDEAGSEAELAAEMAELFASNAPFRVIPVPGDSGLQNISRLLNDRHIDVGFVSTDVLADAKTQSSVPNLANKLQVVARFCPQEVHVVTRADIKSLAELAGRKVNFGPAGGSSAVTAAILFQALNIEVEPLALDGHTAIEQLTQGAIAAAVIIGAKPTPLIAAIPAGSGLQLLPIKFSASLEDAYLPTGFDHDDYPNLIEMETEIPSVATGMVLLTAASKDDQAMPTALRAWSTRSSLASASSRRTAGIQNGARSISRRACRGGPGTRRPRLGYYSIRTKARRRASRQRSRLAQLSQVCPRAKIRGKPCSKTSSSGSALRGISALFLSEGEAGRVTPGGKTARFSNTEYDHDGFHHALPGRAWFATAASTARPRSFHAGKSGGHPRRALGRNPPKCLSAERVAAASEARSLPHNATPFACGAAQGLDSG